MIFGENAFRTICDADAGQRPVYADEISAMTPEPRNKLMPINSILRTTAHQEATLAHLRRAADARFSGRLSI